MNSRTEQAARRRAIEKLFADVGAFILRRKESDGGYAPVEEKEIIALSEIVYAIVELKWQRDPDGDVPVTFQLVDKTRYETPHFLLIPHSHKGAKGDLKPYEQAVDAAIFNVTIAADKLDVSYKILRAHKEKT